MKDAVAKSKFPSYAKRLRTLNEVILREGGLPYPHIEDAAAHLDGLASRELRSAVSRPDLRRLGAFFTGEALAKEAVSMHKALQGVTRAYDPACGCGDLLLALARQLPIKEDLEKTLVLWGERLTGSDCVPEFVEIAKQRLMLLAVQRGARIRMPLTLPHLNQLFPGLVTSVGPVDDLLAVADFVIVNPPFGLVQAPEDISWASGRVTDAALWVARLAEGASGEAEVVAVLPDVLRSGSRYKKWRSKIARQLDIREVRIVGQFDVLTDVDVFLLHGKRSNENLNSSWPEAEPASTTLDSVCAVSVGPVVDKRDPHVGPWAPYITTHDLPQEGEFRATRNRRFAGKLFQPPFVLVRRTSRPSEGHPRLRPVLVRGAKPVAIENHLVVLKPRIRSLAEAKRVIAALDNPSTTEWLNKRIRTRHLTVSSLREIPLVDEWRAGLWEDP